MNEKEKKSLSSLSLCCLYRQILYIIYIYGYPQQVQEKEVLSFSRLFLFLHTFIIWYDMYVHIDCSFGMHLTSFNLCLYSGEEKESFPSRNDKEVVPLYFSSYRAIPFNQSVSISISIYWKRNTLISFPFHLMCIYIYILYIHTVNGSERNMCTLLSMVLMCLLYSLFIDIVYAHSTVIYRKRWKWKSQTLSFNLVSSDTKLKGKEVFYIFLFLSFQHAHDIMSIHSSFFS